MRDLTHQSDCQPQLKTMVYTALHQKGIPRPQLFGRLLILFNVVIILYIARLVTMDSGNNFTIKLRNLPKQFKYIQSVEHNITSDLDYRLRAILKCHNRSYKPQILQRGDYWVLTNYVRADHGELKCYESITYATHADYSFLENLIPLLDRFRAPVSISLNAPGTDFQPTLDSISYLRNCLPDSNLVRMYATFHIYFSNKHTPTNIPNHTEVLNNPFNCTLPAPYLNVSSDQMYKTQHQVVYPINVARNIARDAALTHFMLVSDIELYPSPGLVKSFLEMIARNESSLNRKFPRVFPLPIFELAANVSAPRNKTELQNYFDNGKAILFHKYICASCHKVPRFDEWLAANETDKMEVFHIGKRLDTFKHWEPIFIGTHADPHYDYRLNWDGQGDKMPQGYVLCALDYEYHVLNNAFLVHRPGIKMNARKGKHHDKLRADTNKLIINVIYPELKSLYGIREGCSVF